MLSWLINSDNTKAEKKRFYRGWVILAILFTIGIVVWGIRFSFGVFFVPLQAEFSLSRAETSWVFSTYTIICCVSAFLGGVAVDRYGVKKVILVMGTLTILSLLLTSQAHALWQLFITYSLLLGLGTGGVYIIMMATVSRWFTTRRGLAIGVVSTAVGTGTLIMTPVSAHLLNSYGWQTSYLILGIIALVVIIPCALLLKEAPGETEMLPNPGKLASPKKSTVAPKAFTLAQAVRTKNFWIMFLAWGLFSFCVFMVLTHIIPHAIDLGFSSLQAATILTVNGGSNILGRLTGGRLSDILGRKQAAVICAVLLAASMLWLTMIHDLWMLYVFAVIFGFSFGGFGPPTAAMVSDIFGLRHIGSLLGVLEVSYSMGAAAGPALAGYVFDSTGGYNPAFFAGMATALISMVLVLLVKLPTANREAPD